MPTKMDKTLGTYYPMLYQLNYTKDYTDSISHLLDGKVHVFNASIGAELDD